MESTPFVEVLGVSEGLDLEYYVVRTFGGANRIREPAAVWSMAYPQ